MTYPPDFRLCPHDGSSLQPDGSSFREYEDHGKDAWPPGKVIGGKYVIFAQTGDDEVARVYRVRSLELDEPRSLRALRAGIARDAAAAQEFRRTAWLLQKVAHPNLVGIEACGDAEDGRPFVVTEVAAGTSLAELMCAEGPLETLRACSIARQIATALVVAHEVGLLHLGLSPSNILVSGLASGRAEGERVKVQGFGTVSVRASRERNGPSCARLSLRDLIPLHAAYCSPEQALGRHLDRLDARADLYSLGVLIYHMLTGRLPFWQPAADTGSLASIAEADLAPLVSHLEDAPLPLSLGGRAEPPEPLMNLVVQLLEKRPELRPATARAVIEKIKLAEDEMASRALLGVAQSAEISAISPVQVDAAEAVAVVAPAPGNEGPELPPLPVLPASPEAALNALISETAAVPASAAQSTPNSVFEVAVAQEPAVPAAGAVAVAATANQPSARQDSTSVLFKAQPPKPTHRGRWVWATLSLLIVVAGVWFFLTRAQTQWLGSGPLSPIKSDELRTVEGANTTESPAPASKPSSETSQPSASGGAAGTSPAAANQAEESRPQSSAAKRRLVMPTAAPPPVSPEDLAAEVKRAVAAGDIFFELGQYDLAIQAYQRPLKLDPNNFQLRIKIQRAQSAKNAEQQYLGQP
ncbi:MAG TPA: protein kinase [Terriglobia bacterium]